MVASLSKGAGLEVRVLGSGSGFPGARRDTSGLLVRTPDGATLVDCPGGVVHKLALAGLDPDQVTRVILTHDHVDHLYGFPHLLHALAIQGVRETLVVHAPADTLVAVRGMVEVHGLRGQRYPELELRSVSMQPGVELVATGRMTIRGTPAAHSRDTVALRFDGYGASVGHSSDTRPSEAVAELARDADLLFHDCAGPHRLRDGFSVNHSSALEAARIAAAAGARRLVLIHLGREADELLGEVLDEARGSFTGDVVAAGDGDLFRLGDGWSESP